MMPPVAVGTKWFFEDASASIDTLELEWRELVLSARYQSDSLTEEKIMTAWLACTREWLSPCGQRIRSC
jgi:hypothetical protein